MQLLPFAHFLLRLLDFIEHYLVWRENEVLFDHWAKLNFNRNAKYETKQFIF